MPLTVLNGPTIPAGESLSDSLDCSAGDIVRITMPKEWDNAAITFQASTDDVGYNDLYGPDGQELRVATKAGVGILLDVSRTLAVAFLKIRSGSADEPVPQTEQRTFAVTIKS
jgi:hypothetical protein